METIAVVGMRDTRYALLAICAYTGATGFVVYTVAANATNRVAVVPLPTRFGTRVLGRKYLGLLRCHRQSIPIRIRRVIAHDYTRCGSPDPCRIGHPRCRRWRVVGGDRVGQETKQRDARSFRRRRIESHREYILV